MSLLLPSPPPPLIGFRKDYGLETHPLVADYIRREPEVMQAVIQFIQGQRGPMIDVAGPPTDAALAARAKSGKYDVALALPVIRLHLKMVKHHLSGDPGVKVSMSDKDFAELKTWYMRQARGAKMAQIVGA